MGVKTPRQWVANDGPTTPASWAPGITGAVEVDGAISVTFPALSLTEDDDIGATYQGTGAHTLYGAAIVISQTHYWWVTVDGVGADPQLAGMTGVQVDMTGSGPWTGTQVATAAESAAGALSYTLARTDETIEVSGGNLDPTAAVAVQDGLTNFDGRGSAGILGLTDLTVGGSTASNTTGWMQVLPANVPSGPFRVVGFEVLRGSNITNGVRMAVASGGANFDPETAVVDHDRTMGNSGVNTWHREWLDHDEVVYYNGGETLWTGIHGDGGSSSVFGGSGADGGTNEDGSTNLWLTDGTSGSTTPFVSPVGAVTSSFDFGVAIRLVIQEAPYQDDGNYRVITGAIQGQHDDDLFASGTEIEDIFVAWGFRAPDLQGLTLYDVTANFRNHADAGEDNFKRFELWNALGGTSTFVGDTLAGLIGVTDGDTPDGWSSVMTESPISLTPGGDYRYSVKGVVSTGTLFEVDLGGRTVNEVGYPAYALANTTPTTQGTVAPFSDGELEVDLGIDETSLDMDPQTATASPNNADGTIQTPGNLGMISLILGTPGPVVAEVT